MIPFKLQYFCERYPFEWKTPLGYLGCMIIQIPTVFIAAEVFYVASSSLCALCYVVTAFTEDLKRCLRQLNVNLVKSVGKRLNLSERKKLLVIVIDFIEFQSAARELRFIIFNRK